MKKEFSHQTFFWRMSKFHIIVFFLTSTVPSGTAICVQFILNSSSNCLLWHSGSFNFSDDVTEFGETNERCVLILKNMSWLMVCLKPLHRKNIFVLQYFLSLFIPTILVANSNPRYVLNWATDTEVCTLDYNFWLVHT